MFQDERAQAGDPVPIPLLAAIVVVVCALVLLATVVGVASAATSSSSTSTASSMVVQNNSTNIGDVAPYYENVTADVNNETWMTGREVATLENVTAYFTRVGAFVIGSGYSAQGGAAAAGPLLLGLVVVGVLLGVTANTRIGSVGGGVVAVTAVFGIVSVGIAPMWLYPVVLFILGLVAAALALRVFR